VTIIIQNPKFPAKTLLPKCINFQVGNQHEGFDYGRCYHAKAKDKTVKDGKNDTLFSYSYVQYCKFFLKQGIKFKLRTTVKTSWKISFS